MPAEDAVRRTKLLCPHSDVFRTFCRLLIVVFLHTVCSVRSLNSTHWINGTCKKAAEGCDKPGSMNEPLFFLSLLIK